MSLENADRSIDVRGEICPYPTIRIKETLKKLTPGQVLEVLTDYEPAVRITVPGFCFQAGHGFEVVELDRKSWRVRIRKGP